MISKIGDRKISITPKNLKENEKHCDKCDGTGWLYVEKENEKYIERCPVCDNGIIHICPDCGNETGKSTWCNNESCRRKRDEESESRLYEKAVKYTLENVPKEYCEYFFTDTYGYDNGYFTDIDSLEDYCKDNDIDIPKFIWGTSSKSLSIDADNIVSNELEEWYEDAFDRVDGNELAKLQIALDDFCKNCGVGDCYEVNYKVCIEI
jgi:hypothetical protein